MSTAGPITANGDKGVVTWTVSVGSSAAALKPLEETVKVMGIVVGKEVNRVPWARLIIADGDPSTNDFPVSNEDALIPGQHVRIEVGYSSDEAQLFQGVVVKNAIKVLDGSQSTLVIDCKDIAVQMTIGRKSTYHEQETDQEVLEDLIKNYSDLSGDVEATAAQYTNQGVVQYNATDWDFMLSRAEANGMLVNVDDATVTIAQPGSDSSVLTLEYGTNLLEFEAETDARTQFDAIESMAWDPSIQDLESKTPATPKVTAPGNLSGSDLSSVIGLETLELRHSGKLVDTELQAWVDARAIKSALARVCGRARFDGYPDLKPTNYVTLSGLGDRFNGDAFVTGVRHTIQGGTWTTDAQIGLSEQWFAHKPNIVDLPAGGLLPSVTGLQIGTVTEIESDPDGEDRIRVTLPLINKEEEGIWARVACLDAGEHRGTFFRPEEQDEVVVGFLNDDPRDPIILGMLNSSSKPAPVEAAADNNEKGIYTRSGMRLAFNDDDRSITLMTMASGEDLKGLRDSGPKADDNNSIILSDSDGSIVIQDKNGNKIELGSDGITISSDKTIKLEGQTIEVEASNKLLATSNSTSEFSSSGTTALKGTMVNIN